MKRRYDEVGSAMKQMHQQQLRVVEHLYKLFSDVLQSVKQICEQFDRFMADFEKLLAASGRSPVISRCTNWVYQYFANAQFFITFRGELEGQLLGEIKKLQSDCEKHEFTLSESLESAKSRLVEEERDYEEVYKAYEEQCREVERVGAEMDSDPLKKARYESQFREQRDKCLQMEQEAVDANSKLAMSVRLYELSVEKSMLEWEDHQKTFYTSVQNVINVFGGLVQQLDLAYSVIVEASTAEIEKLNAWGKQNKKDDSATAKKVSSIVNQFSLLPQVSIDIFKYLSWKVVFHQDLHASYLAATHDVEPDTDGHIALRVGQIVRVVKEKRGNVLVETIETGLRGWAPKGSFKPLARYQRLVHKLVRDHDNIHAGQYVIQLVERPSSILCRTAYGQMVEIPRDKLAVAEDDT